MSSLKEKAALLLKQTDLAGRAVPQNCAKIPRFHGKMAMAQGFPKNKHVHVTKLPGRIRTQWAAYNSNSSNDNNISLISSGNFDIDMVCLHINITQHQWHSLFTKSTKIYRASAPSSLADAHHLCHPPQPGVHLPTQLLGAPGHCRSRWCSPKLPQHCHPNRQSHSAGSWCRDYTPKPSQRFHPNVRRCLKKRSDTWKWKRARTSTRCSKAVPSKLANSHIFFRKQKRRGTRSSSTKF